MMKIRTRSNKTQKVKEEDMTLSAIDKAIKFSPYSVTLPGIGLPDRLRCKLKYISTSNFGNSPTPSAQVFRVNSLFDPDLTGTGHQPSFYDLLSGGYSKYIVLGTWAKVTLSNNSASVTFTGTAVYSDNDASSQTEETLSESRYAMTAQLGLATGGASTRTLEFPYMPMWKLHGIPPAGLESDPNMYSGTSSNPTDPAFFYFKVAASDLTTAGIVTWKVELLFDCVFKDVNPSYPS
jgi:hypothetical protein